VTTRRTSNPLAIPLSCFSGELYRDVARSWRGVGVVYLLLVNALCAVPTIIKIQAGISFAIRANREARPASEEMAPSQG